MERNIDVESLAARAAEYFGEGYHCAEAVVAAFLEEIGEDPTEPVAHITAFGGGFGKSFSEACGVISGSLLVVGHLHGRRERGDAWDVPAQLAEKVRKRFFDTYGTTNCGVLRERFGEEAQMARCRELVGWGVVVLAEVLREFAEVQETDAVDFET